MSDPTSTLVEMFHPWRLLRHRADVTLLQEDEPGLLGSWCERTRTLRYGTTLNQAERRCTIAHELVHVERGDNGHPECHPSVHREAARRLITIKALADALLFYGDDETQLAEELWVDLITLRTRLAHLHPCERGYLRRRLSMKEHTA